MRLLTAVFLLLPASLLARPPVPANPMEKLETAIPHGIKLLEAKKHAEFLKAFVEPEHLKEMEKTGLDAVAKEFGADKAATLLAALKEIKDAKPKIDEKEKKAVFSFKGETMVFRQHGKTWHIQN